MINQHRDLMGNEDVRIFRLSIIALYRYHSIVLKKGRKKYLYNNFNSKEMKEGISHLKSSLSFSFVRAKGR